MEESNVDSWLINFEPNFPYFLQDFEQLDQLAPSPMIPNLSSLSPAEGCLSNSNSDADPRPEVCTTSLAPVSNLADAVTHQTKKKRKPRNKIWNSRITKERNSTTDGQEIGKSDSSNDINLSPSTGRGKKRSYETKPDGDRGKNSTGSGDEVPQFGLHKKDHHVITERLRREKLTQRFIALSSLLPGLSRMDKVSVLEDAIKYVKQLQERVETLEAQTLSKTVQQSDIEKEPQSIPDEYCNSDYRAENLVHDEQPSNGRSLPEIEVRIFQQRVIIKIHCDKQKGILAKALSEIETNGVTIVTTSIVPFTSSSIFMTVIAKVDQELSLNVEDVGKRIKFALSSFRYSN